MSNLGPYLENPEVSHLLLESRALSSALACTRTGGDPEKALELTQKASQGHQVHDVQDHVVKCAMSRILGEAPQALNLTARVKDANTRMFVSVAQDWIDWVAKDSVEKNPPSRRPSEVLRKETLHGGALEELALDFWYRAVRFLQEDLPEARRFFERASEVGSSYGIGINYSIQWTYAASFFPTYC